MMSDDNFLRFDLLLAHAGEHWHTADVALQRDTVCSTKRLKRFDTNGSTTNHMRLDYKVLVFQQMALCTGQIAVLF